MTIREKVEDRLRPVEEVIYLKSKEKKRESKITMRTDPQMRTPSGRGS